MHSPGALRPFFAVTIVGWLFGFAFGPAKARPLLLSLAPLMALTWATVEVADANTASRVPFAPSFTFGSGSSSSDSSTFTTNPDGSINRNSFPPNTDFTIGRPHEPNFGEIGGVSLAFGFVYLVGVALPGVIAMVEAVTFLGVEAKSVVVAGLLSVAAGLFVGSVGTQSHRRFTGVGRRVRRDRRCRPAGRQGHRRDNQLA